MIRTGKVRAAYSRNSGGETKTFSEELLTFTLETAGATYAFAASEEGFLLHVYYGKKLGDDDLSYLLRLNENPFSLKSNLRDKVSFMDAKGFEYPCHGTGDFREPCLTVMDKDGMSACELKYRSHEIVKGKPALQQKDVPCIPSTWSSQDEAETLIVTMHDSHLALRAELMYTVFSGLDVITRSVRFYNEGSDSIGLRSVLSACVDFDSDKYDMITLNGGWGRERMVERAPLRHGKQRIDSSRGESSHQYNPFAALASRSADEDSGEVFGFNLIYSGNFIAQAEVTQHDMTRFVIGINPFDFEWKLLPGYDFQTPEAVMVHSSQGIGQMSRTFHDLYRSNLIRGEWKNKTRPVLINNWEATYFDFTDEKLVAIARQASELGIEMLVMDDGWFGHRDSDSSSLGDWFVNGQKISGGLKKLADTVNSFGMKFGIWFEPEMVSPDSRLYRSHPDWAVQVKGRPLSMSRAQYVLDFSNKEARDFVYGMMKNVLDSANIEYVKWDMNRCLTEAGSLSLPADRQREIWHRYVLGVYDLMNRLTTDYPHILLENCSGGGGRFDGGMLYFSPQIWTSDDMDAAERLKIQHGTSLCYPPSSMGAHVSDCPNHTVGRTTPFGARGDVALMGTFGYELDVTRISAEDRNSIPLQIAKFKKYSPLVRTGDLYRIGNVFRDGSWDAWMFVSKDKSEALLTVVQVLARPNYVSRIYKLKGLEPERKYRVEELGLTLSGRTLMNAGLPVEMHGDFSSRTFHIAG